MSGSVNSGGRGGHKKYIPKAFTEKGLYMLATILKSAKATQTTLAIVETFAKMRELGRNIKELTQASDTEENELMQKTGGTGLGHLCQRPRTARKRDDFRAELRRAQGQTHHQTGQEKTKMSVHISERTIDNLVRSMKHWDEESKQEFVTRLLAPPEPKAAVDPSEFFGTWEDDRDIEEVVRDIYESRRSSSEKESLE